GFEVIGQLYPLAFARIVDERRDEVAEGRHMTPGPVGIVRKFNGAVDGEDGGGGLGGKDKPPVQDSVFKWVQAVSAPVKPAEDREAHGVRTRHYGPGSDGAEVVFITIESQGHVWPGGKNLLPEFMVGKATDKLKAVDVVWEFFEKHPLPPTPANSREQK
ncbi:MAG: hypothetical protein WCJ07_13850, partial [Verrucomicrobiota bacterium]